ncbi:hypothetical protein [Pedobacter alpinus]|uniref:Outer membrane protein beta-barrel domain-containing protein n=1 Tax=Pedobacter alpinus TaxID=1590643 RepID=A0ABW5TTA7_9SPHI
MNSIKYLILTIFLFSLCSVKAQKLNNTQTNDSLPKQLKPLQLIDGQILGPGLFLSVNYDTRFKPKNKGLGLRLGIGSSLLGLTFPLSINYLIGNNNKRSFLDIGAGVTLYIPSEQSWNQFEQTTLLPNTYIMYRYQALKSANTFRIGLSQMRIFEDSGFIPYYPSISLGHILNRRN